MGGSTNVVYTGCIPDESCSRVNYERSYNSSTYQNCQRVFLIKLIRELLYNSSNCMSSRLVNQQRSTPPIELGLFKSQFACSKCSENNVVRTTMIGPVSVV